MFNHILLGKILSCFINIYLDMLWWNGGEWIYGQSVIFTFSPQYRLPYSLSHIVNISMEILPNLKFLKHSKEKEEKLLILIDLYIWLLFKNQITKTSWIDCNKWGSEVLCNDLCTKLTSTPWSYDWLPIDKMLLLYLLHSHHFYSVYF